MFSTRITLMLVLCVAWGALARATVTLPALISDNMVLQAGKPLPIWGMADPGEQVTVTLADDTAVATADAAGKWQVRLKARQADGMPVTLTVAGANTLTVKNVLVGSVWICSGQSNMDFGFNGSHNANTERPAANYPKLRQFTVGHKPSPFPQANCVGKWVECSPATVNAFSAVAYFFGHDVHLATGQPVGLIKTSWGGTAAQLWTSQEGLAVEPSLDVLAKEAETAAKNFSQVMEQYEKEIVPKYQADLLAYNEAKAKFDADHQAWVDAKKNAAADGPPVPEEPVLTLKRPSWPPSPKTRLNVSSLFNGMIAPLIPYALDGAIWYQGEANVSNPKQYQILFPAMIRDWRGRWGQGDFPMYFVQLANYLARKPTPSESNWAGLREAQLKTLALPKTGMAVIIDIGMADNIHPTDKMDVGHRLALWALHDVFGKQLTYSGPLYTGMQVENTAIRLSFREIGGGLTIGAAPGMTPDTVLKGFAIAGTDKRWVWADARIDGDTVVVSSDKVAQPVAVRYAWADNPECNLYNKDGLPASPFRTDDW